MTKLMKLCSGALLAFSALFIFSCAEDDFEGTTYPVNAYEAKGGALVEFSDVVNGFFGFDFASQKFANESFVEFTVEKYAGEDVQSVDVMVKYNGVDLVLLETLSSLPATVRIDFTDLLPAVGVSESAVVLGDLVTFSLENIKTASGSFGTSNVIKAPVSCASELAGTFDYVSTELVAANSTTACPAGEVTGTVTFTAVGGGDYLVSDLGFGQYESSCWNDGPATSGGATFNDVCGKITTGGLDQYNLVYTWVITDVSGPNLSISWSNDYADSGKTVLTRPDGSDWPLIFTE